MAAVAGNAGGLAAGSWRYQRQNGQLRGHSRALQGYRLVILVLGTYLD